MLLLHFKTLPSGVGGFTTMKNLLIAAFCIFCLSSCDVLFPNGGYGGNAPNSGGDRSQQQTPQQNPQQTPQQTPQSQTPIDRGVSVRNIQLTNDYTILSMTCTNNNRPRYDQNGRMINDGSDNIAFHPQGVLIGMNGARRFKFVRVEGIPTDPQRMVLKPGQKIDFTVFFERLDRGIEEFDLFECQDGEQYVCWNLYNLYVKNPAPQTYPQQTPTQTPTQVPPSTQTKTPNAPVDPRKLPEQNPPKTSTPTPTPVVLKGVILKGIVRDAKTNLPITAFLKTLN